MYDRSCIEQYISGADQMIDDDDTERKGFNKGFKSGIRCALNELDMMMVEFVDTVVEEDKTLAEKGWEYVKMLTDRDKDQNLFGKLIDDHNGYKFKVEVWKGDWNNCPSEEEPIELVVSKVMSWMLTNWNNDETGGPGLLITSIFETPNGKPYSFNVIIPKDELIKALASLVRD